MAVIIDGTTGVATPGVTDTGNLSVSGTTALTNPLPATSGGTGATSLASISVGNLSGGSAGTIPYQSTVGTTAMLATGTNGQVLTSSGAGAPSWTTPSSGLAASSQAQMEAATDNTVAVTPLSTNWHPGVSKAWVVVGVSGDITASRNVTSVTDGGVGTVTMNMTTPFSSADFAAVVSAQYGNQFCLGIETSPTASTVKVQVRTPAGASLDPVKTHIVCFGDQA